MRPATPHYRVFVVLVGLLVVAAMGCRGIRIPIFAPTPTPSPTPTPPPTTGSLVGMLLAAPVTDSAAQRPSLTHALIVLCRKASPNECVVDKRLSTRTDGESKFAFDTVPPGEYVVLYDPFTRDDASSYWEHWGGRVLRFADARGLFESMAGGREEEFRVASGQDGGVRLSIVQGSLYPDVVLGNTAIWMEAFPLVVEFVHEQEPLTATIVVGETTEVTINAHATGADTLRQPASPANPVASAAVGVPVRCGDLFEVTVLSPARFQRTIHDHTARGTFLVVQLQILNLTGAKYQNLFEEDYEVRGTVRGQSVVVPSAFGPSFDLYYDLSLSNHNISFYTDDVYPGYPFETIVAFDVNPEGRDWTLWFQPNSFLANPDCAVALPLQ